MSTGPLVQAEHVTVHFGAKAGWLRGRGRVVHAVDDVSCSIERGESLGLVGESGCGKSTMGRALTRLVKADSGRVMFDGVDLSSMSTSALRRARRRMQPIYQDPYASLNPRMTAGALIGEPLTVHRLSKGADATERVSQLLELVGLSRSDTKRYPHEFSGGQRQRIAIARALAVEPEFVVCDEPVSALDVAIQGQILNLITALRRELGLTLLFIAHDLAVIRRISDRVAVMYLGQIVEIGPAQSIFDGAAHPYTRSLLSAIPVPNPRVERSRQRMLLEGDVPSPIDPPSGCRFHTRCWLYNKLGKPAKCREEPPAHRNAGEHHAVGCHFFEQAREAASSAVME